MEAPLPSVMAVSLGHCSALQLSTLLNLPSWACMPPMTDLWLSMERFARCPLTSRARSVVKCSVKIPHKSEISTLSKTNPPNMQHDNSNAAYA